jgi:hypothetical protein
VIKRKEKGGKREGKFKKFLASIASSFWCSVATGLPLNRHGGFCLLKPWRPQCPCNWKTLAMPLVTPVVDLSWMGDFADSNEFYEKMQF